MHLPLLPLLSLYPMYSSATTPLSRSCLYDSIHACQPIRFTGIHGLTAPDPISEPQPIAHYCVRPCYAAGVALAAGCRNLVRRPWRDVSTSVVYAIECMLTCSAASPPLLYPARPSLFRSYDPFTSHPVTQSCVPSTFRFPLSLPPRVRSPMFMFPPLRCRSDAIGQDIFTVCIEEA